MISDIYNWIIKHKYVMVGVFASSAMYLRFEPYSGQIKDYEICIYFFSSKHAAGERSKTGSESMIMCPCGIPTDCCTASPLNTQQEKDQRLVQNQ